MVGSLILEDDDGEGIPRPHVGAVEAGANRGAVGAVTTGGFDSFNCTVSRSSLVCIFKSSENSAVAFSSFKHASSNPFVQLSLSPLSS